MCAIALLIAVADGFPIIYSQTRVGRGGVHFRLKKFRTMRRDAEAGGEAVWARPHDDRCTRLGGHLRRFGLDEIPQLWNVIRGEMSLIGPRPERPEFARAFARRYPEYRTREQVRPGITGYAQVRGWRGDTDIGSRLEHDLFYIRNRSLVMDARILIETLRCGWVERARRG